MFAQQPARANFTPMNVSQGRSRNTGFSGKGGGAGASPATGGKGGGSSMAAFPTAFGPNALQQGLGSGMMPSAVMQQLPLSNYARPDQNSVLRGGFPGAALGNSIVAQAPYQPQQAMSSAQFIAQATGQQPLNNAGLIGGLYGGGI
jgi:hypothetical protein